MSAFLKADQPKTHWSMDLKIEPYVYYYVRKQLLKFLFTYLQNSRSCISLCRNTSEKSSQKMIRALFTLRVKMDTCNSNTSASKWLKCSPHTTPPSYYWKYAVKTSFDPSNTGEARCKRRVSFGASNKALHVDARILARWRSTLWGAPNKARSRRVIWSTCHARQIKHVRDALEARHMKHVPRASNKARSRRVGGASNKARSRCVGGASYEARPTRVK